MTPVLTKTATTVKSPALPAEWRDFLALTKPRVMVLVVYTGIIGMLMAPVALPLALGFTAILCIALAAGASGALNQWYEADIDALMKRTMKRPLPDGRMDAQSALHFGVGLSGFAVLTMGFALNWLAAGILLGSILFYVVIYTVWLKRRTPQNIVIGGAAGAFPPLIGWAAATGQVSALPVLMFALVFFWTPPHFWSLALFMEADYGAAGVPMMPNVAGERSTRRQILFYTLPMAVCAIAPWALGMTGLVYGIAAIVLTAIFAALAFRVSKRTSDAAMKAERQLFKYSILYLFALFGVLLVDKFI
ncbi:protoheme IX farnesyltransferase [Sphingomonas paeninsulae]|jgi:protoheme IX farnesyltransferase|uniref:Protoheme IX farnesyltransferase n=1 Tax=Sphingomonas paeninsulae TaxID=2319844 RepID=A0A494THP5_SPHPE|nr:protoheme IX farnesyltransferase [Sphingomonas paeninsulae]